MKDFSRKRGNRPQINLVARDAANAGHNRQIDASRGRQNQNDRATSQ
jgi:hypothetical protein